MESVAHGKLCHEGGAFYIELGWKPPTASHHVPLSDAMRSLNERHFIGLDQSGQHDPKLFENLSPSGWASVCFRAWSSHLFSFKNAMKDVCDCVMAKYEMSQLVRMGLLIAQSA